MDSAGDGGENSTRQLSVCMSCQVTCSSFTHVLKSPLIISCPNGTVDCAVIRGGGEGEEEGEEEGKGRRKGKGPGGGGEGGEDCIRGAQHSRIILSCTATDLQKSRKISPTK